LRQVIHNLLRNAEDALEGRPDGQVAIKTEAANKTARLSIADNGPGFPAEILHKVIEPYVTTKPKGTGLGLAIVKKIMEENQAAIAVRNRTDAQGVILGVTVELEFAYRPPVSENSSYV
jgi:nitrogen fixation/metabolism regulation signal transduction histidine kinase